MYGGDQFIIYEDITHQKRLEAQLRQAQKMEAIGTLAGGIAHDFNNILAAILGYTQLVDLDIEEGTKTKANLKEVLKSIQRARDLVKQILTFSRKADMERKPLRIGPIVKEALKLLRASLPASIEIHHEIEQDVGIVEADPTQIHQIMMNLCTNAAHAIGTKGGLLEVDLSNVNINGHGEASIEGLDPGVYLKLSVRDTGHGMDPDIMERIFEPYFTTKEKETGTGLGLATTHGIVKGHQGAITVESESGKGCVFNVYLPIIETEIEPEVEDTSPMAMGDEKILYVDDEPILTEMGKKMLERLGYRVTVRSSSIEALELFRSKPHHFDLVITDMTMPYMTGEKLAHECMKIRSNIPVILCSGFSEMMDERRAKDIGISAFLMKPIIMEELAKTIRKTLKEDAPS
jgi:nitrogen-specific signal transduction histidine kinase/CheY-like chemotaxis protein